MVNHRDFPQQPALCRFVAGKTVLVLSSANTGNRVPFASRNAAGINFKGFFQSMNPENVKRLEWCNLDAGLLGRIGLTMILKRKKCAEI